MRALEGLQSGPEGMIKRGDGQLDQPVGNQRNFSTKGYNFTFKFNAKNALDVLTNEKNYIPPKAKYDPSSPTQTDKEDDTPEAMDIDRETPKRTVQN